VFDIFEGKLKHRMIEKVKKMGGNAILGYNEVVFLLCVLCVVVLCVVCCVL
jgi:hypothetical protein